MSYKILLADNSPIILEVMRFGFEEEELDLITTNSQEGLLEFIEQNKYDLIIIEDNLLVNNLMTKIKKSEINFNSYIFIISEKTNPITKKKFKNLGASGWIIKPFTPRKLAKTIKQFLIDNSN